MENNGHVPQKSFCSRTTHLDGEILLGQVVHRADEVEDLHHVHPRDAEPAPASRHVVRFVDAIPVKSSGKDLLQQ